MRNFQVIKSVFSEPWYISPDMLPQLHAYLSGLFSPNMEFEPKGEGDLARVFHSVNITRGDSKKVEKIGVIEIIGTMYKYETLCAWGMENYREYIRMHDQDPEVRATVIVFDTPGGSVHGIHELGEEIRNASKPVIAFVSDQMCSAGYWAGSCCREIIANNATATIGSIGVMCTFTDLSKYYEKQGVNIRDIYAPQSSDKNQEYRDLLKGNEALTLNRLKVYADEFHSLVRANRSGIEDEQLTGKVYFAGDVVGSLIDKIGSFEDALIRAAELADEMELSESTGSSEASDLDAHVTEHQSLKNMSKFNVAALVALATAAGVHAFESVDETVTLTAEQAKAINARLEELVTQATEAVKTNAKANEDLAAAAATIESLQAENADLKKGPGAEHSFVDKDTDGHGESPSDDFAENFAKGREFLESIK